MTKLLACDRPRKLWLWVLLMVFSVVFRVHSELVSGTMDVHWNEGSEDCVKNPQPPIQIHQYNAQTFILRESLCATYEAPFIYLLIGKTKALLIDTGAVANAKLMPLAQTVISLLPKGINRPELRSQRLGFASRSSFAIEDQDVWNTLVNGVQGHG